MRPFSVFQSKTWYKKLLVENRELVHPAVSDVLKSNDRSFSIRTACMSRNGLFVCMSQPSLIVTRRESSAALSWRQLKDFYLV